MERWFMRSMAIAWKPASTTGRLSASGWIMQEVMMMPPRLISRMRAKSGVVERCGQSTCAVRPIRISVASSAKAESSRGQISVTPIARQPARISQ
jgi:hypothetical protein